jgi:hypothetical protein
VLHPWSNLRDSAGLVIYGEGADSTHPLSVDRRQFFREAKSSPGLVFGLPLKSRISNRWVLPLARQLRIAHGEFEGVVYVNLDVEEFAGDASIAEARGARGDHAFSTCVLNDAFFALKRAWSRQITKRIIIDELVRVVLKHSRRASVATGRLDGAGSN